MGFNYTKNCFNKPAVNIYQTVMQDFEKSIFLHFFCFVCRYIKMRGFLYRTAEIELLEGGTSDTYLGILSVNIAF